MLNTLSKKEAFVSVGDLDVFAKWFYLKRKKIAGLAKQSQDQEDWLQDF